MSQTTLAVEGWSEGIGCAGRCDCGKSCSGNRTEPSHAHRCANCFWSSLPHEVRHRDLEAMGYLARCSCANLEGSVRP